jgi:hypothetical protein
MNNTNLNPLFDVVFDSHETVVESALTEILESDSVKELPEIITPSEDDFESEEAYQQELNYIDSDISFVEAEIRSVLAQLPFLSEDEKELFRLMVWQHIDFKKGYTYNFPNLHPENILKSRE